VLEAIYREYDLYKAFSRVTQGDEAYKRQAFSRIRIATILDTVSEVVQTKGERIYQSLNDVYYHWI
jgi:hypothetical protein